MAAGVLGYRLLGVADRVRVLVGGLRLLAMKTPARSAARRAHRRRRCSICSDRPRRRDGPSGTRSRSPPSTTTRRSPPPISSPRSWCARSSRQGRRAIRALPGRTLGSLHRRRAALHRGARRPRRDQGARRRHRGARRRGHAPRAARRAAAHRAGLRERGTAAGSLSAAAARGAARRARARRDRAARQLADRLGARLVRSAAPRRRLRRLRRDADALVLQSRQDHAGAIRAAGATSRSSSRGRAPSSISTPTRSSPRRSPTCGA